MSRFLLSTFFLTLLGLSVQAQQRKGLYTAQDTERRLALVIGNQTYTRVGDRLENPLNDAADMAAKLDSLGFEVIRRNDLGRLRLEAELDGFSAKLANYDVGLFYYSGHGIRGIDGQNYLVPVDANMTYQNQVPSQCIALKRLLDGMEGAAAKVSLVFLDACRDNRLKSILKSPGVEMGLVIPNNPPGSFVAFATRDGRPSIGLPNARNSLFTAELLKHIERLVWEFGLLWIEPHKGLLINVKS